MQKISGFTLIELIVVLAIVVILAMASVPLGKFVRNNTNTSYIHELVSTLNFARSSGISAGSEVVVCAISENDYNALVDADDTNDEIGCSNGNSWRNGWMVFLDPDGDGSFTNGTTGDPQGNNGNPSTEDDDPLLKIHAPLPSNYSLNAALFGPNIVTYTSVGQSIASQGTWTLCDPSDDLTLARSAILAKSGRVRLGEDSNDDGIRENGAGDNLSCL